MPENFSSNFTTTQTTNYSRNASRNGLFSPLEVSLISRDSNISGEITQAYSSIISRSDIKNAEIQKLGGGGLFTIPSEFQPVTLICLNEDGELLVDAQEIIALDGLSTSGVVTNGETRVYLHNTNHSNFLLTMKRFGEEAVFESVDDQESFLPVNTDEMVVIFKDEPIGSSNLQAGHGAFVE